MNPVSSFQRASDDKRMAFLTELLRGASASLAAARANLNRGSVYRWKLEDPEFAAVWAVRAALPPNHPRRPAPYVPDFKKAFDHFCLHAGGRGVIEGLSKQLALPAGKQAPSYNSLFWYGNTSSASLWYAVC